MRPELCCQGTVRIGEDARRPAWRLSGGGKIAGCIVPTAMLAFLPKCPACVAMYLALATGLGISLPTATYVRAGVILLCVACLMFVIAKIAQDFFARKFAG